MKHADGIGSMMYGRTSIVVCGDALDLGQRAAEAFTAAVRDLLAGKDEINVIFAAGESQTTFLDALARKSDIPWDRVNCFNMDDFWDVRMPEEFTCGWQTRRQLYDIVHPRSWHVVRWNAPDPFEEARRFEDLVRSAGPMDILCQGIGTSGHLALNEPGDTDFGDPVWVRVVDLAPQSKRQLIDDPNFRGLGYIPDKGITMTIPAMLTAPRVFTMVPYALKRDIVRKVLATPAPDPMVPASILRVVPGTLFLDRDPWSGER